MLSRGRCYNPECPSREPIIKFRHGDPYTDYEIAHIRDAKQGNRYVKDMTDEERRAFAQPRVAVHAVSQAGRQGPPPGLPDQGSESLSGPFGQG